MIKYDVPLGLADDNNLFKLIKNVNLNSKILEFGPSTGRLTNYLSNKLHCEVFGVEIDPNAFEKCRQYLKDGICSDIETYEWTKKFIGMKFDYVIFADVLEHLRDPKKVISVVKDFLEKNGKVLVSIPNIAHNSVVIELLQNRFDYNPTGLLDNTHIHFFTESTCKEMFASCEYHLAYSDGTVAEPYNTEINNSLDPFPESVKQYLNSREYANLYQIIFVFQLEQCECVDKLSQCKQREYLSKVYLDEGNGISEASFLLKSLNAYEDVQKIIIEAKDVNNNLKAFHIKLVDNFLSKCRIISVTCDNQEIPYRFTGCPIYTDNEYLILNQEKLVVEFKTNSIYHIEFEYYLLDAMEALSYYIDAYTRVSTYKTTNKITNIFKQNKLFSKIGHLIKKRDDNLAHKIAVINIETEQRNLKLKQCKIEYHNSFVENINAQYVVVCFQNAQINNDYLKDIFSFMKHHNYDAVFSDCIDNLGNSYYKSDYSYEHLILQAQEYDVLFLSFEIYQSLKNTFDLQSVKNSYEFILKLSQVTEQIGHCPEIGYVKSQMSPIIDANVISNIEDNVQVKYQNSIKKIEHINNTHINIRYKSIDMKPKVSIIIPMKDKASLTNDCIQSIQSVSTYTNYEIVILNNKSEEKETYDWFESIKENDNIKVIDANFEFNWSKLNNFGIEHSDGEVFLFLNNDTLIITPDWIERLAEDALRDGNGVVGALLLYEDNTIQHAGVVVGMNGFADHIYKQESLECKSMVFVSPLDKRNVLAVTGACMAISKKTIERIGLFNDTFIICGSDVEICIRAYKNGLKNVYDPYVRLYHLESKSRDSYIPPIDFEMSLKHYAPYREQGDPYFNHNLSDKNTTPRKKGI